MTKKNLRAYQRKFHNEDELGLNLNKRKLIKSSMVYKYPFQVLKNNPLNIKDKVKKNYKEKNLDHSINTLHLQNIQ